MKNRVILYILAAFLCLNAQHSSAQTVETCTCAALNPSTGAAGGQLCGSSNFAFSTGCANGGAGTGANYGCLATQPRPAYTFVAYNSPGAVTLNITNAPSSDVDAAIWGPFTALPGTACGAALGAPLACNYDVTTTVALNASFTVPATASPANPVYYILLVTFYSNAATTVSVAPGGAVAPSCPCTNVTPPTGALSITNSTCTNACAVPAGGTIAQGTKSCPSGQFLQYSLNGGAFSSTLPTYNQTTAMSIATRCACNAVTPNIYSAIDNTATTAPATCPATTPLTATAPPNIVISACNAALPAAHTTAAAFIAAGGAISGSGTYSVSSSDAIVSGCTTVTTRTYVVTSVCNGVTTTRNVTQTITRTTDTVNPTATNPATTALAGCNAAVPAPNILLVIDEADNCSTPTVAFVSDAITMSGCLETTARRYSVTDACGNSITVTHTITRTVDNTAPSVTTAAGGVTPISCPSAPAFTAPVFTDACGVVTTTFTDVDVAGGCAGTFTRTRTYTGTDACGNRTTSSFAIQVQDNTAPTITTAAGGVTPISCPNSPAFTAPVFADACGAVTVTFADVDVAGACVGTYTRTRTYTGTDACGNRTTSSFAIQVQDVTAPSVTTAAGGVTPISCPSAPVFVAPVFADACGAVTVTFADVDVAGGCAGTFTRTRTYTGTDDCGNATTSSFSIEVQDITAPTITTAAGGVTPISCPSVPAFTAPVFADACGVVSVTFADVDVAGACAGTYTRTRTYTGTDACGNATTNSFSIVVQDNTAPSITTAAGGVTPISCPNSPAFTAPVFTDACGAVTVTFADVDVAGGCAGTFTRTRTYTGTDDCGNATTSSFAIQVQDITAPSVTTAAGGVTPISCPSAPAFTAPVFTDACGAVTTTFTDVDVAGACAGTYTRTRTYTGTDACGNRTTSSFAIQVQDNTAPSVTTAAGGVTPISCPSVPAFTAPVFADACGVVSVTFADVDVAGTCVGTYTRTRTYTGTDDCGNATTSSFSIEVQDITAPTITTAASGVTPISCPSVPVFTAPVFTDACGAVTTTFTDVDVAGACAGTFTRTRTYTGTDDCGNRTTSSFAIQVQDITAPSVTTAAGGVTPISCPSAPAFTAPVFADECSAVAVTFADVDVVGGCAGTFTRTRTYTGTDDCGNATTSSFSIEVQDITAPTITTAASGVTPISCPSVPAFTAPVFADACGVVSVTFADVDVAGTCVGTYTRTRTYTGTDDCGNATTSSFSIEVQDITAPSVTTAAGGVTPISCPSVPVFTAPVFTDACGAVTVTFTDVDVAGACAGTYTRTRTYTGTDACGNRTTSSFSIVVRDVTAPSVTTAAGGVTPISCPSVPAFTAPVFADACGVVSVTFADVDVAGACAGTYTRTRTYTGTDACGNATTNSFSIVVQDNTAPSITTAAGGVTPISCPNSPAFTAPVFTDACGAVTVTFADVDVAGGCAGTFTRTRTYTGTDDCGNATTSSFAIQVQDITAPSVTTAAGGVTPISCPSAPAFTAPVFTDACGVVTTTFTDVDVAGACAGTFTRTRTYTGTDACGNRTTSSFSIVVQDNTAPSITTAAGGVTPISCPSAPAFTAPVFTDACGVVTVTFADVDVAGACAGTFTRTRTYTGTDACGNRTTSSFSIEVQDISAPSVTTAAGGVTPISCPNSPAFTAPVFADACGVVTVTFVDVDVAGGCAGTFTRTRTYTGTDDCGNATTSSFSIEVQDVTAPSITIAASGVTPISCPAAPAFTASVFTDECSVVTVTFADVDVAGACAGTFTRTRTYTGTDACGNATTSSFSIVVQDNTAPSVTTAAGGVTPISCPNTPAFTAPVFTDECSAVTVTFADVDVAGACAGTFTRTRTYTGTDDCGNATTSSFSIEVQDITAPSVTTAAGGVTPISCPNSPAFTAPVFTDACGVVTTTFTDVDVVGGCAGTFTRTRTYTGTDDCGNATTNSFSIVVQDNTAPSITTAAGGVTPISCPNSPAFTAPVFADECSAVTVMFADVDVAGACAGTFTRTRTYTGTDDCGNATTSSFSIEIQDITAPTITTAAGGVTPISCPNSPAFIAPVFSDACGVVTVTFTDVDVAGACAGTFTRTRTYTGTDDCGNATTSSFSIEVQDITAPSVTTAAGGVTPISCPSAPVFVAPVFVAPVFADECSVVTVTFADVDVAGACAGTFTRTRTYTGTDDCGNATTSSFSIEVQDISAPSITTAASGVTPISCPNTPAFTAPVFTDECSVVTTTFTDVDVAGACAGTYTRTRTYTGTDACGNRTTSSFSIEVQDITAPTVATAAGGVTPISCPNSPAFTALVFADECSAVTVTFADVDVAGACAGTYTRTRTYTGTDACGNRTTSSFAIQVQDNTAPSVTTAASGVTPISCPSAPVFVAPVFADECSAVTTTFTDVDVAGTCAGTFTRTRTYTGTDDCGNATTSSFSIEVQDITAPSVTTAASGVTPISCPNTPAFTAPVFTDECSAVAVTFADVDVAGAFAGTFTRTRTYTGTDDCGNATTSSFSIEVQDITAPTASDPATITLVGCGATVPAADVSVVTDAADNCATPVVMFVGDVVSTVGCTETTTRTYSVTDASANTINVTQQITRTVDSTPPTASAIADQILSCGAAVPAPNLADVTSADNCTSIPVVTIFATNTGINAGVETTIYTYRITDDCGNFTDVTQKYIRGITAPSISTSSLPVMCMGAGFDLASIPVTDANATAGTLTYHYAAPASAANELTSSVVNPTVDSSYCILKTANYGCTSEIMVRIVLKPNPVNDACTGALPLTTTPGQANAGQTNQDMTCATQDANNNPSFSGGGCGAPLLANNPIYYSFTTNGVGDLLSIDLSNCVFPSGTSLRAGVFAANCNGPLTQTSDCAIFNSAGTQQIIPALAPNTSYVLVLDAMTAGAPIKYDIRLLNTGSLPVQLLSFTGKAENEFNRLNWVTTSEINNDYFDLERSADGLVFEKIAKIKGNGTTNQIINYQHKDLTPLVGTNKYRLRQNDFDGRFTYSNVVTLYNIVDKFKFFVAYPNPTKNTLNVPVFSPQHSNVQIVVRDIRGRTIYATEQTIEIGLNTLTIDASKWAEGMYMLTAIDAETGTTTNTKFVKE